jgi:N utilization substance protein B
MLNSQLNSKSIARIAAIQTLYQFENDKQDTNIETLLLQIVDFYRDKDIKSDYEIDSKSLLKLKPSFNYLKELVKHTHDNIQEIDQIIANYLNNEWTIKSLPTLLCATLRVSICEMKYFPETPRNVIINEYTDIASDMLDEAQIGFVNSVLDRYANKRQDT